MNIQRTTQKENLAIDGKMEVPFNKIAKVAKEYFPESHSISNERGSIVIVQNNEDKISFIEWDKGKNILVMNHASSLNPRVKKKDFSETFQKLDLLRRRIEKEFCHNWWRRCFSRKKKPRELVYLNTYE